MPNIREITTEWTMSSGPGKLTVMYFGVSPFISAQRTALNTFWTSIKASLDNSCSYVISTTGRELDVSTGALVGGWTEPTARSGTGSGTTEQVADATQGLIRTQTGVIVNGRFLQGRIFVPGLSIAALSNGNLGSSTQTTFQSAINALISAGVELDVWHRPIAGSGGSASLVTAATVPAELSVLRRRRG